MNIKLFAKLSEVQEKRLTFGKNITLVSVICVHL